MPVSDPGDSPVEQAREFVRRGQRRFAVELLEPWIEDYPDDADAWSTLAAAYFELDDHPDALRAAQRAADLKPDSARSLSNLGMILRRIGKLAEAEKMQYQALTVDSTYERARTELRKIHELRTGQRHPHQKL